MPSKQQRLLFTPSPEARRILDALHDLTGQSRAALVSELLDAGLPSLELILEAHQLVLTAPDKARDMLALHAAERVNELTQAQLELDKAVDGRTVKGKRARARRGRHAGGTP
jgi:hypothetical protein